jgi:hypothetical protein
MKEELLGSDFGDLFPSSPLMKKAQSKLTKEERKNKKLPGVVDLLSEEELQAKL